jgi:hypothetical protein
MSADQRIQLLVPSQHTTKFGGFTPAWVVVKVEIKLDLKNIGWESVYLNLLGSGQRPVAVS